MATLASGAELAAVHVVGSVTASAVLGEVVGDVILVTRGAFEVGMACRQCKPGLHSVIEIHGYPAVRAVTAPAIRPVPAFVHVITAVARIAVRPAQVLEIAGLVAVLTGEPTMAAVERKARYGPVVETDLRPARGGMTVPAPGSVAALVYVIPSVAICAGASDLGEDFAAMTRRARNAFVCTGQGKRGGVMIEARLIPIRFPVARSA